MIEELRRLSHVHRQNGILVDANLLLLLVVGRLDQRRISTFDRLNAFVVDDFLLLELIVRQFAKIVSTPHVLTEVSNLATRLGIPFRDVFRQTIEIVDERACSAKTAANHKYFRKLGLTDAAILALASRQFLLLTADASLAQVSQATGGDAVNFNHLRPYAWQGRL